MTDVLNVRNTLNIEYNYDKTDQSTGYFTLDLRRDNKTYTPEELNNGDITYFNLSDHVVKTWPAKMINGKITLKAEDFPDLRHAGTYAITAIVDGIIFPSQGQCTLTLDGSFTQGDPIKTQTISGTPGKDGAGIESVNVDDSGNMSFTMTDGRTLTAKVTMPEAVKGDKGDSGLSAYQLAQQAGFSGTLQEWLNSLKGAKGDAGSKGDTGKGIKNVKYNDGDLFIYYTDGSNDAVSLPLLKGDTGKAGLGIKNVTLVGNTLSVVMDDGTSHQLTLPLLKGDKGENGQDGANVSEITISGNTLFFHYTDGLTYSAQLPLLKGDPGEKGQDAPKISDVSLNGNTLTFTLSDKSTYSVLLPLLKGDAGTNGKSAYEIAVQYGFKGTETEWLQSLKGSKGDPGEKGQDAPKITNVSLNDDQTQIVFHFSDGTDLQTRFQAPQAIPGPAGKDGKDAPKITGAKFNADQTKIIFTLSNSNTIEANFKPPHDGTIGKDGVGIKDVSYTGGYLNFTLSDDSVKSVKLELPSGPIGPSGKDAPTITKAEVTNNNLIFTLSDGQSVTAALPNLKGSNGKDGKNAPTITKADVKDKQLIFTLSDNSTVNVDISQLSNSTSDSNVVFYDLNDNKGNISKIPLLLTDFKVIMHQQNVTINETNGIINEFKFVAHVAPLQKDDKIFYLRNTSYRSIRLPHDYLTHTLYIANDYHTFYKFDLPYPTTHETLLPYGSEEPVDAHLRLPSNGNDASGRIISLSNPYVYYTYFGGVLIITISYYDFNVSKDSLEQVTTMKEGTSFKGLALAYIQ